MLPQGHESDFGSQMAFAKFCNSQHVDFLLGGSLRFSSLAYFRHLEEVFDDTWIGDRFEGVAHTVQQTVPKEPLTERDVKASLNVGISVPVGSRVQLSNNSAIESCGHWLIFSFSEQPAPSLDVWNEGVPDKLRYDAYVEISDISLLKETIWRTGEIDGVPIKDSLNKFADSRKGRSSPL